ncbi:pyrimidine 5'-nucleotidase [Pseudoalteromonas sp. SCSIO 43201]|uniref:Putative hydrolase of the HAD superfamily n=1 Tax=Pseudoalteromonas peptidolytica F12-50-A1 TaxID=1315280 RepID=A0A8I0MXC9_9GAMM|nr:MULTISPECIES: pyrimidine 5'-nucleotidase [Pseudoalteromonas]MBE0347228.1 putative hydrolase of the HAD superfamily [Pseudoalteromonas peptidolytica F12-50-A1]NLR13867.1 pyrimidine 5'-nucleotidase [Pseudoalteromonas peptidolytica]USD29016.1 pyrimidine 5'-nucleotidase [Pseudoalteromonas sp. SCSIO 43201]GEK08249.1 dUMP phosphatase [Pseudoalteromonas peptidolytica]
MSHYSHILFDADETLFSFNAKLGLQKLFAHYDVVFSDADYEEYNSLNAPLWVKYQNGEIDAKTLQVTRFKRWATKLNVTPETLNAGFLAAMAEICQPLSGARALLDSLKGQCTLAVITNGFAALQQKRLEHTGLIDRFSEVVISELVGKAKPDPSIFEHTLALLGNPDKSKVLMVGDTPASDILGANRFGIDSCWLQHEGKVCPDHIKPTYTVKSLAQLQAILKG